MHYVISDIHGCYEQLISLLDRIHFNEEDTLYLLGDLVDRGPKPMKVLQYAMSFSNIIPILGNHDYLAATILKKFNEEITEENYNKLTQLDLMDYASWTNDGGQVTSDDFYRLSRKQRKEVLDYLFDFRLYEEVTVNKKKFILTHAGLGNYKPRKSLERYTLEELIFNRQDLKVEIKGKNTYLISGHTPTILLREDHQPLIVEKNHHIVIDCGCVFGFQLAAYCLETGEVIYEARN